MKNDFFVFDRLGLEKTTDTQKESVYIKKTVALLIEGRTYDSITLTITGQIVITVNLDDCAITYKDFEYDSVSDNKTSGSTEPYLYQFDSGLMSEFLLTASLSKPKIRIENEKMEPAGNTINYSFTAVATSSFAETTKRRDYEVTYLRDKYGELIYILGEPVMEQKPGDWYVSLNRRNDISEGRTFSFTCNCPSNK